jgi:hypothetical protein
LSPCEPPARGFVDGPGEICGREHEDAARISNSGGGGALLAGGSTGKVAPLDQKLGFNSTRGFMFTPCACRKERVDFIDEDYAGGQCFGEGEKRTDELFAFSELWL